VAVGIHYLLFLCGPMWLLARPSAHNVRDYAARYGWPRYDPADPLFARGYEDHYQIFGELLQEVPAEVIRRMRDAMTVGAGDPVRRPTYYQWTEALKTAQTPLAISIFRVVPGSTVEGHPVRLEWEVTGARRVSIDQGIGDVAHDGSQELVPLHNQTWTLTAEGRNGAVITAAAPVSVWPLPVIRSVFVPAPDLRHSVVLRDVRIPAPHVSIAAPRIRLAAPSIRLPLTLDLSVRLGSDPVPRFPDPLLVRSAPATPAAPWWTRGDWVPRIGDTLQHLAARLRAEIAARFGGSGP